LTQLWNYPRASVPVHESNRLFYTKNTGLQNQSVLYVQNDGASPRLLLDPNTLSKDGTVNLSSYEARKDGKMLVYGLSASGSDWEDWYFKDVDSGKTLPDHLKWLKNAHATWAPDGKGVYYGRFDEPKSAEMFREANYFQKLFYHQLGTDQSEDKLVYERKDQKEWDFDPVITDDGKYLIIEVSHGTSPKNGIFIKDLTDPASKVVELFQPGVAMYQPVGNDGSTFWFVTDEDAPKAKIIAVSTQLTQSGIHGDKADLIKSTNDTLESASFINDRFICTYLQDAASAVVLYDKNGHKESDLKLPGIGTASGFGGHQYDKETYYSFSGFVTPPAVYKLDVAANRSQVFL
jgi:prolyl oligopeptidase